MIHRPALLLLAVLWGGLGASWVDAEHHAEVWAEGRAVHETDAAHGSGTRAAPPCDDGSLRIDCAVCAGLSGAVVAHAGLADDVGEAPGVGEAEEAWAEVRRAIAPARGPPAAA